MSSARRPGLASVSAFAEAALPERTRTPAEGV
jgi:hypothetical protein